MRLCNWYSTHNSEHVQFDCGKKHILWDIKWYFHCCECATYYCINPSSWIWHLFFFFFFIFAKNQEILIEFYREKWPVRLVDLWKWFETTENITEQRQSKHYSQKRTGFFFLFWKDFVEIQLLSWTCFHCVFFPSSFWCSLFVFVWLVFCFFLLFGRRIEDFRPSVYTLIRRSHRFSLHTVSYL